MRLRYGVGDLRSGSNSISIVREKIENEISSCIWYVHVNIIPSSKN